MATGHPKPWPRDRRGEPVRRIRIAGANNRNLYWRRDGRIEIGYRDSAGRQRWAGAFETITAARAQRDAVLGARGKGEHVQPSPRLSFGEVADRWLAVQVTQLRPATRAIYRNAVDNHLIPRWGGRRMDSLDVGDVAALVRDLRAQGLAEWTIVGVLKVVNRVFKFARRHCGWRGENPIPLLEKGERPRPSDAPERRIYQGDELAQTLAACTEPWRTLFRLAAVVGGRESELLALWWENLNLTDPSNATMRFSHQLDRGGNRVPLKTEESKATLPLPRATAQMLLEHKERCDHVGARAFLFASRSGRPLSQRNVLRALYRAQERARDSDGRPTFPELFEHDGRGELVVDANGAFVPRRMPRRELPPLPDFHALRHTAAMDCDDAEEARDLLRHRNSNVTRAIYRAHFEDKRREQLRARMEARMEAADGNGRQDATRRQNDK
jgi:integrase